MKTEDINFDAVKEYMLLPDEDGFTKESVDKVYMGTIYRQSRLKGGRHINVIFIEGKCPFFGRYKERIEIDEYKSLLRDYNLRKILNDKV